MTDLRIVAIDNVWARLDCERSLLQELSDVFTFDVPGAKFMAKYKSGWWDGKIRLVDGKGRRLHAGLVAQAVSHCADNGYSVEVDPSLYPDEFSLHEAKRFVETLGLPDGMDERDYQLDNFVHAVRNRRALYLSPTASGKSFNIYLIMRYIARPTLVVVPSTGLVHQMRKDFASYGFDSDALVHCIADGAPKASDRPVVVATWQSIFRLPPEYLERFDVVFVDEAHEAKAKSVTGLMEKMPGARYRFGFTGTLDGTVTNRMVLEGLFGPVRQVTTSRELMDRGYLAEIDVRAVVLQYPDEVRKAHAKDDYQTEMDFLVTCGARNRFIKNLALSLPGNTLVLFQYVDKHGRALHDAIASESSRPVHFVSGEVESLDREDIREAVMASTESTIIASYGVYQRGVNLPNLNNLVLASPSKSRVRVLQSIGRVLRRTDEKTTAQLIDIGDDLKWGKRRNHTLGHFVERLKMYSTEGFPYTVYDVQLKD